MIAYSVRNNDTYLQKLRKPCLLLIYDNVKFILFFINIEFGMVLLMINCNVFSIVFMCLLGKKIHYFDE